LISDLSGNEIKNGGESISFSYRGADYTIDLSAKEAEAFGKAIAVYIEHGQKQRGGSRRIGNMRRHHQGGTDREHLKAAREWLRAHGYQVSDRGRIKAELLDLYDNRPL
jgi:hypothetical protein